MNRENLEFRYYFNAGLNKETGICDEEGSDVFEIDSNGSSHYIGSIPFVFPSEISEMTDRELEEAFDLNMIFPNIV